MKRPSTFLIFSSIVLLTHVDSVFGNTNAGAQCQQQPLKDKPLKGSTEGRSPAFMPHTHLRPPTSSHNKPARATTSLEYMKKPTKDSTQRFQNDVQYVLKNLLAAEYCQDPTVPNIFKYPIYDKEQWWTDHLSRWRYVRYLKDLPFKSRLLQRLLPQMLVLIIWSCSAVLLIQKNKLEKDHPVLFSRINMGLPSMSLVSTFVAALLTLRGNQGLSRLAEARKAIAEVNVICREMAQLVSCSAIYSKHPQLVLFALRHVALVSWTLKAHLQGTDIEPSDEIVTALLPNPEDSKYVIYYKQSPPIAMLQRLRQIFIYLGEEAGSNSVSKEQYKQLNQLLWRLNQGYMVCERIRISPIPPLYTTHMTRLLLFYLFWLPLVLLNSAKLSALASVLVTIVVGYAMLGLDEISHILELPFRFMPLRQLSKVSIMECADSICYQPPPLYSHDTGGDSSSGTGETTSILTSGAFHHETGAQHNRVIAASSPYDNKPSYW